LKKYYDNIHFYNSNSKYRLKSILRNHVKTVLRLELRDTYKQLFDIRRKIFKNYKIISETLPNLVGNSFFGHQERNNGWFWRGERLRMDKKVEWLMLKQRKEIKSRIKPIFYNCSTEGKICWRSHKKQGLDNRNSDLCRTEASHTIRILPDRYVLTSPLNKLHEKWFVNLSDLEIPHEVKLLLQLGKVRFTVAGIR